MHTLVEHLVKEGQGEAQQVRETSLWRHLEMQMPLKEQYYTGRDEEGATEASDVMAQCYYNGLQDINAVTASTSVTDGAAAGVSELNDFLNMQIPNTISSYAPDFLMGQPRASPFEVERYLSGETIVNWSAVKQELGLEERTASLTLQEQQQETRQPVPSTSNSMFTTQYDTNNCEGSSGASYTDITSTMRVTREATNALYNDPEIPPTCDTPSELTQYLSSTALSPQEANYEFQQEYSRVPQGQSSCPTAALTFMSTPSPSSNSDGSYGAFTTSPPQYSPQHQPQNGYFSTYIQDQTSQQSNIASPSHLPNHSPPSSCMFTESTATYNHVAYDSPPAYGIIPDQSSPTYDSYCVFPEQTPPTYTNGCNQPPALCRISHFSPQTTPHTSPSHAQLFLEDSKIRNGKMYTTYLSHGRVTPNYERPGRHPSGPTPSTSAVTHLHMSDNYSQHMFPLPPSVPLTRFLQEYRNAVLPYQPTAHQERQFLPGFGSLAFQNICGSQSSVQPPQAAAQFPIPGPSPYAPSGVSAASASSSQGGACHKTGDCSSLPPLQQPKEETQDSNIHQRELAARRAAKKLDGGVLGKNKRGNICHLCQICFASSGHLKRHMEAHGSNRRFKCNHTYCDIAYSRQDNLKNHIAKAIHRRDGDPYAIPISDTEESDTEV